MPASILALAFVRAARLHEQAEVRVWQLAELSALKDRRETIEVRDVIPAIQRVSR